MRLDSRQIRFTTSFLPSRRTRTLRLGGRRGSVSLQEPALVIEGELLRFRLFGIEWLFRQALSEWTTVTMPYSRILAVQQARAWLVRLISLLAVIAAWTVATLIFRSTPRADAATVIIVVILTVLFGYIAARVRPTATIIYKAKDGRRVRVTIWVRKRANRHAFLEALAAHRGAAARYVTPR